MISVILGDVINSRSITDHSQWLNPLKKLLSTCGSQPLNWEITRGDNFQLELPEPEFSLQMALRIKRLIKSLGIRDLDVRMSIGIGEKSFQGTRVSESNGEAFINCGEKFESLKKIKQNLAIKTPWPTVDTEINLLLRFASIIMDKWTPSSAEVMYLQLMAKKPLSQKDLIKILELNQSSVSERLTRARSEEILELELFYRNLISKHTRHDAAH